MGDVTHRLVFLVLATCNQTSPSNSLFRTRLEGPVVDDDHDGNRHRGASCPDNIRDAIRLFKGSKFAQAMGGAQVHEKHAD